VQDSPPAHELLDTIAAFLEQEVMPDYEGRKAFQVRIAASVCRILARETRLDPGFLREESQTLASLLGPAQAGATIEKEVRAQAARLAGAIREGELAYDSPELLAAVRQLVEHKVAVVNPRYRAGGGA
jgi:hypothetical protein